VNKVPASADNIPLTKNDNLLINGKSSLALNMTKLSPHFAINHKTEEASILLVITFVLGDLTCASRLASLVEAKQDFVIANKTGNDIKDGNVWPSKASD
jgi:hypothetical protein